MPKPIATFKQQYSAAGKQLHAFARDQEKDQLRALMQVASWILRDAKRFAPVRTAALRRSGRLEKRGKMEIAVAFGGKGTGVDYAPFVEFGRSPGRQPPAGEIESWANAMTGDAGNAFSIARGIARSGVKPQPYLRPAMIKNKQQLIKVATANLTKSWNRRAMKTR